MMKFICVIFSFLVANSLAAQLYSTIGKEFLISIPTLHTFYGINDISAIVRITSEKKCTGAIKNSNGFYSQSFSVTPGTQTIIELLVYLVVRLCAAGRFSILIIIIIIISV